MSLLTACAVLTVAAAPSTVLVAPYQSLGVEPPTVTAITEGFREASKRPQFEVLPASESDKVMRSAMMCGEDSGCLSTLGQRSGARWVLAFGVGKVGASLLLTAIFVDVTAGKELVRGSRRVPEQVTDWTLVTRSLADEVVKPPAEPTVVQVPIEVVKPVKPHVFRPWAFATVAAAAALGLVATVVGLLAWNNYNLIREDPLNDSLRKLQVGYNGSADVLLIASVLHGAAAVVFFILDYVEKPVVVTE